jgi:hypothetical protein
MLVERVIKTVYRLEQFPFAWHFSSAILFFVLIFLCYCLFIVDLLVELMFIPQYEVCR